jgi:hypothetical protein
MAVPYSYDLRQKAIEAVKRGERKSDVCRMLKISRNPLLPVAQAGRTNGGLSSHHKLPKRLSA